MQKNLNLINKIITNRIIISIALGTLVSESKKLSIKTNLQELPIVWTNYYFSIIWDWNQAIRARGHTHHNYMQVKRILLPQPGCNILM